MTLYFPLLIILKKAVFDDQCFDVLELPKFIEELQHALMVMSDTHDLDISPKHDQVSIISSNNPHWLFPDAENQYISQYSYPSLFFNDTITQSLEESYLARPFMKHIFFYFLYVFQV